MAARIDDLLVLGQNISKTDLAKYLRDREAVLPFDFGGLGDGAANDRAAMTGRLRWRHCGFTACRRMRQRSCPAALRCPRAGGR